MQDLTETLELIRLSIYISFVITGGAILYFVILFLMRIFKKRSSHKHELQNLHRDNLNMYCRISDIEQHLIKTSKGKFKPNYE